MNAVERHAVCKCALFLYCLCACSLAFPQPQDSLPTIAPDKAKLNLVTFVQPEYPALAKAARIHGIVHISFTVDETGSVKELKLLSGHPMLAPAALEAVRKWKYKPFQVDGKTVAVQTDVEFSIPENVSLADIEQEQRFQEAYWQNERAGRSALDKQDLVTAEAKLQIARTAAEERVDEKWLELADVLSMLGTVKLEQNNFTAAEEFYKQSLAIHEKHQRPDEAEVAGAQLNLALLYFRMKQPEKSEPLLLQSVKTYEARIRATDLPEPRAGYGRSLALGYFGLAQLAAADGRTRESQERCAEAVRYAGKWSGPSDRDVIFSHCGNSSPQ